MASRSTSATVVKGTYNAQKRNLDSFLRKHSMALAESQKLSTFNSPNDAGAALFQQKKSPTTGRWLRPIYSLRKQAKLVRQAVLEDRLDEMPPGPATVRFANRIAKFQEHAALEAQLSQFRYAPPPQPDHIVPVDRGLRAKSMKPSQRVSPMEKAEAEKIAKAHVKQVGPYSGRRQIFKHSKFDREKPARMASVQSKLEAMPQIIKDWQQAKQDAQRKLKPGLPF